MDRLASITAFVRVAENGGFSAAARSLDVSTTTVSDQVQALENALGVRLLNRTTRRVSLTEIGREYYERCIQILHELEEADQAASALQQTPRGLLRVYCHQGFAPPVGAVVAGFLARHPETSVDLRTGDVMIDLVREVRSRDHVDVAARFHARETASGGLALRRLRRASLSRKACPAAEPGRPRGP